MPIYAKYGVPHAWLVDPRTRTVEVYRLAARQWQEIGRFAGDATARLPPFDAAALDLGALWTDESD
jgi:Uma2 family endonuclease